MVAVAVAAAVTVDLQLVAVAAAAGGVGKTDWKKCTSVPPVVHHRHPRSIFPPPSSCYRASMNCTADWKRGNEHKTAFCLALALALSNTDQVANQKWQKLNDENSNLLCATTRVILPVRTSWRIVKKRAN